MELLDHLPRMSLLIATVGAVTSMMSLLTLGVAWLRPSYAGWRSWSIGNAALVLGILVGVTQTPPTLLSVLLGNGLVMIGMALLVSSFQRFSGVPWSRRSAAIEGAVLVSLLLIVWTFTRHDNLTVRLVLVAGYLGVKTVQLFVLLFRQRRQHPDLRGAYTFNLAVLVLVRVLTFPRLLTLGSGLKSDEVLALTWPNLLTALSILLLSVGGTLAFWVLHEDRRKAEVAALHRQLTLFAYHDPLTSVLNRRGLWKEFGRWQHDVQAQAATLLVMDVNRFKALNDLQGHAAGDRCLKVLGAALQEVAAAGDLAARVGGDEFALLLTGSSAQITAQLRVLTERFQERADQSAAFSVSFGCTWVKRGETLDAAMMRADEDMYRHKASSCEQTDQVLCAAPDPRPSLPQDWRAPLARRSAR